MNTFEIKIQVPANSQKEAEESVEGVKKLFEMYTAEDIQALGGLLEDKKIKSIVDKQIKVAKMANKARKKVTKAFASKGISLGKFK